MNLLTGGRVIPIIILLTVANALVFETVPVYGEETEIAGATISRPLATASDYEVVQAKEETIAPLIRHVFVISETTTAVDQNGVVLVKGKAANTDTVARSASLEATFYNEKGEAIGTAVGLVEDVNPGETVSFELISTTKVTGFSDYSVSLGSLLEKYGEATL